MGEASPPQVEVGAGYAFASAEYGHGLVANDEALEALYPPAGDGRVRTGRRIGRDGILREKETMLSTINHPSIT